MRDNDYWPRVWAIGLLVVLFLCSFVAIGFIGANITTTIEYEENYWYGDEIPYPEPIIALIMAAFTILFSVWVLFVVHGRRAKGAAVGWIGAILLFAWAALNSYDIYFQSTSYDAGPDYGFFLARLILTCIILLILVAIVVIAYRARGKPQGQHPPAYDPEPQGKWAWVFVPANAAVPAHAGAPAQYVPPAHDEAPAQDVSPAQYQAPAEYRAPPQELAPDQYEAKQETQVSSPRALSSIGKAETVVDVDGKE